MEKTQWLPSLNAQHKEKLGFNTRSAGQGRLLLGTSGLALWALAPSQATGGSVTGRALHPASLLHFRGTAAVQQAVSLRFLGLDWVPVASGPLSVWELSAPRQGHSPAPLPWDGGSRTLQGKAEWARQAT